MRRRLMLLLLAAASCGRRATTLRGRVTVDGEPAAGIPLGFYCVGVGTPAYAETDKDGYYDAAVTFRKRSIEPGARIVRLMPTAEGLPKRYFLEIERITVEPGYNERNFSLQSR